MKDIHFVSNKRGLTLLELLVVIAIFVIAITATLTFLSTYTKRTSQEMSKTKTTQTGIISELVLARDIAMAGMGVPIEEGNQFVPISSLNNQGPNNSDELIIKGSVISSGANDYFKWGYNTSYINSGDVNINVSALPETGNSSNYPSDFFTLRRSNYQHPFETGDRIVFLNAETKELVSGKIYKINGVTPSSISLDTATDFSAMDKSVLIFSLGGISVSNFSQYLAQFTGYKLSSSTQSYCAGGAHSLVRMYGSSSMPVLDCVLDFQVQFGLVDSNSGAITWVNDLSAYTPSELKEKLRLVKVFIVKQYGKKDDHYTYPNTSISTADNTITLTSEQRHYRWRTISLEIPLREIK